MLKVVSIAALFLMSSFITNKNFGYDPPGKIKSIHAFKLKGLMEGR